MNKPKGALVHPWNETNAKSLELAPHSYRDIYGRTVIRGMVCFCTSQNKHTFDKFSMTLKTKETLSKSNQNLRKYKKCCEKPIKPRQIQKKPTKALKKTK